MKQDQGGISVHSGQAWKEGLRDFSAENGVVWGAEEGCRGSGGASCQPRGHGARQLLTVGGFTPL